MSVLLSAKSEPPPINPLSSAVARSADAVGALWIAADERWSINSDLVPECGDCFTFRDKRDPKQFEEFCVRLIRNRRRKRSTAVADPDLLCGLSQEELDLLDL